MARPTKHGEPAANRSEDILEASLTLFAEKGVKGASMRDIARATGLTEGTLYHYFPGKDRIVSEIIKRYGFSGRAVATAFDETKGTLRTKLTAIGVDFLAVLGANPHVTAFILSEGLRYPAPRDGSESVAGSTADAFLTLVTERTYELAQRLSLEIEASRVSYCDTAQLAAHFFNALSGYWITEVFIAGRMPRPAARRAHLDDLVDLVMCRLQLCDAKK